MKILKIEAITASQVPKVVELEQRCLGGLWTEAGYLREIDSPNSDLIALHLQRDRSTAPSTIVGLGCLWAIVNEAHITLLGVDSEYRRQGWGQLILLNLLESAIARQLEWATLEVNVNNFSALKLYQKFGFETVGKRKNYYQNTGEDALILWRNGIQTVEFKTALSRWQQELSDRLLENQCQLNQS